MLAIDWSYPNHNREKRTDLVIIFGHDIPAYEVAGFDEAQAIWPKYLV